MYLQIYTETYEEFGGNGERGERVICILELILPTSTSHNSLPLHYSNFDYYLLRILLIIDLNYDLKHAHTHTYTHAHTHNHTYTHTHIHT